MHVHYVLSSFEARPRRQRGGKLRQKCRLYGEGVFDAFCGSVAGAIFPLTSPPLLLMYSPLFSLGIQLGVGGGEAVMGKDDICE